ncbi:hypothetical protein MBLNU459_g0313t3 [Dothideomycetes sp. NU459]
MPSNSDLLPTGLNFTATIHKDTYPYISHTGANLSGKSVFITGASRGIGKETALSFAKAGASKIALGARSSLSALETELQEEAKKAGHAAPKVLSVKLDVTSAKSVEDAAKQVQGAFGGLDILMNNAGYLESLKPITEGDPDDWWKTYEINIKGPYLCTRSFLPLLLNTKGGLKTIVNTSSIGAHVISPGLSGYQSTKLALLRVAEFTQEEYKDQGILCYCIHPGGVKTDLATALPQQAIDEWLIDEPQLAADTVVWLTKERREWLGGRYVSVTWDMEELLGKKDEIVKGDLLKVRMANEEGHEVNTATDNPSTPCAECAEWFNNVLTAVRQRCEQWEEHIRPLHDKAEYILDHAIYLDEFSDDDFDDVRSAQLHLGRPETAAMRLSEVEDALRDRARALADFHNAADGSAEREHALEQLSKHETVLRSAARATDVELEPAALAAFVDEAIGLSGLYDRARNPPPMRVRVCDFCGGTGRCACESRADWEELQEAFEGPPLMPEAFYRLRNEYIHMRYEFEGRLDRAPALTEAAVAAIAADAAEAARAEVGSDVETISLPSDLSLADDVELITLASDDSVFGDDDDDDDDDAAAAAAAADTFSNAAVYGDDDEVPLLSDDNEGVDDYTADTVSIASEESDHGEALLFPDV